MPPGFSKSVYANISNEYIKWFCENNCDFEIWVDKQNYKKK